MIRFISLISVLLTVVYVNGQNTMLTNSSVNFSKTIPSPTAGGIAQIASTDVSIFTGLANVQVPVFSVSDGDVVISATLKYNSGGVKVADRPSWVGQNWNLMVGGVITRGQKGDPDEICKAFLSVPSQAGYAESAGLLNVSNWSTAGFLQNYSSTVPTKHIDPQPDEFTFSLPNGESGSFFLNHLNQWEVKTKSSGYFRVVSSEYKLDWVFVSPNPNIGTTTTVKRVFYKFVIKDGKGYTYTFGGLDNAVEFGRGTKRGFDWLDNPIDDNCNGHIVATSWYLTKIVSPLGVVVEFDYLRGKHQYMLNAISSRSGSGFSTPNCSEGSGGAGATMGGYIITPSILSKIRASNFTVDFFADTVKQLDYPFSAYNFNFSSFLDGDLDRLHIAHNNTPSFYEGLNRWYALSRIEIKDYRGQLREKYAFGYEEQQPQLERLFLSSFQKIDVSNTLNRLTHNFEYYDVGSSINHGLPGYCSFKTDLWGYYNGKQYPTSGGQTYTEAQLAALRTMDPAFAIAGSLKKVIYPTGGALELFYQANDYHHVLEKTATEINFIQLSGFGGGLRIWKVRMLDNLGNFTEKRYAYSPMSNTEISSGVLAGFKKDKVAISMGVQSAGNFCSSLVWQFDDFSTLNYTDGRDVVYSEGREYLTDGSYTNYEYSNSNNPAYRDKVPVTVVSNNFEARLMASSGGIVVNSNSSSNINSHLSHISYELERGNLLSKTRYSSVGFLVDREEFVYNDDPTRFNKFVKSISNFENKIRCNLSGDLVQWIEYRENYYQAIKIFTYRPYVIRKYEYTYNANASTYQFRRYDYTYDPETYVLKSVATHNSKSEYKVTSYSYAKDFPSDPLLSDLYNGRSRVEDVVQKTEVLNDRVQLKETINYGYFNNNLHIAPSSVSLARQNMAPFVSIHVDGFNSKGQITKAHKPNDVTITKLYGYNDHLVEAIVENADDVDCFYNSFEWRTGYTIFNPEPFATIADPNAVTGRNVGRVQASRPIKAALNPNKSYVVTYWTRSRTSLYVNTSANGELVKDVGEWRLFKHIVQPVNGQINLGSPSETFIDELRLYPVGALMETFTYDPMVGVTSTCNVRNLVRYYEYDGLGRLVLTRDEFRKILKVFAYNYNAHPND